MLAIAFCEIQAKSDAINILCDVLTPETDSNDVLTNSMNYDNSLSNILEQNVRVTIDVNRHKEVQSCALLEQLYHMPSFVYVEFFGS